MRNAIEEQKGNMILLVPEIHAFNFPIYYVLSFIFKVKTYEICPFLYKFKRIEVLNLSNYFDGEDCTIIMSEAVRELKEILQNIPKPLSEITMKKRKLNLFLKLKQDLQKEIEKLLFLKKILCIFGKNKACIIDSAKIHFLRKFNKSNESLSYQTIRIISCVNIVLDMANLFAINIYEFLKLSYQLFYGMFFNRKLKTNIQYLYDGIAPREVSTDKNDVIFTWIIDGRTISDKDILFLLPRAKARKARSKNFHR